MTSDHERDRDDLRSNAKYWLKPSNLQFQNLRDVDYITTERKFLESVLDAELVDFDDRAVFYSDDGTSFRNIMFMGKLNSYANVPTSKSQ